VVHAPRRDRLVLHVLLIEGAANLVILGLKLAVGVSTGSLAVLGDALHSLTDLANNVVAVVVVRLSAAPADREHPYGHRKFETLAVFGLATLLCVVALELALHAVRRGPAPVTRTTWELVMMLGVLAVNVGIAAWERGWAQRLDSDILLADASHTFGDVLTTVVVIVGWQLSAVGWVWLDRLCAVGVALLLLYLAARLFRRVLPVLLDRVDTEPEVLSAAVRGIRGVRSVARVRSRRLGTIRAIDLVITVAPELPTADAHAIADEVEAMLERRFDARDVSIHVEPDRGDGAAVEPPPITPPRGE